MSGLFLSTDIEYMLKKIEFKIISTKICTFKEIIEVREGTLPLLSL